MIVQYTRTYVFIRLMLLRVFLRGCQAPFAPILSELYITVERNEEKIELLKINGNNNEIMKHRKRDTIFLQIAGRHATIYLTRVREESRRTCLMVGNSSGNSRNHNSKIRASQLVQRCMKDPVVFMSAKDLSKGNNDNNDSNVQAEIITAELWESPS